MSEQLWIDTLVQLPIVAIVLGVVLAAVRHLDKWIIRWSDTQSKEATERQEHIVVLLEQVRSEVANMGDNLSGVVERNTTVIQGINVTMLRTAEAMSALCQGQMSLAAQLTEMNRSLMEHERSVASRPCQQQPARAPRAKAGG